MRKGKAIATYQAVITGAPGKEAAQDCHLRNPAQPPQQAFEINSCESSKCCSANAELQQMLLQSMSLVCIAVDSIDAVAVDLTLPHVST